MRIASEWIRLAIKKLTIKISQLLIKLFKRRNTMQQTITNQGNLRLNLSHPNILTMGYVMSQIQDMVSKDETLQMNVVNERIRRFLQAWIDVHSRESPRYWAPFVSRRLLRRLMFTYVTTGYIRSVKGWSTSALNTFRGKVNSVKYS